MLAAVALAKSGFRFWEGGERRGSSFVDWGVDCGMVLVVIVVTFFSFFFFFALHDPISGSRTVTYPCKRDQVVVRPEIPE